MIKKVPAIHTVLAVDKNDDALKVDSLVVWFKTKTKTFCQGAGYHKKTQYVYVNRPYTF